MGLKNVLACLNSLVVEGIIQDYAIGGGYAAMYYDIPMITYDLDVLVVLPSEKDYHCLYDYFRRGGAKIEEIYIFIEDKPVQFLPNYISPLFNSAIENANIVEFEGLRTKFVSVEYLVALLLTAFRSKDRIRVQSLLNKASKGILLDIIKRFDNEQGLLHKRYKEVLAGS